MEKKNTNSQISKINSFDLLDEIINFEGRVSILTESARHSVVESNVFNFSQYNDSLIKLINFHKNRLLTLKRVKPEDSLDVVKKFSESEKIKMFDVG